MGVLINEVTSKLSLIYAVDLFVANKAEQLILGKQLSCIESLMTCIIQSLIAQLPRRKSLLISL